MGPVLRYADGPIRVPADLPDSARWALEIDGYTDFLENEAGGSRPDNEEWAGQVDRWVMAIKRLSPLWFYSDEFIAVDGNMLGHVRNRCYEVSLNGECQGPEGEGWDADVWPCYECGWCYCWVMLHRIDFWLDRAGSWKNAYISDVDWDVEAEWRRCWFGSPEPESVEVSDRLLRSLTAGADLAKLSIDSPFPKDQHPQT